MGGGHAMENSPLASAIFLIASCISVACILAMAVSLAKKKDERRAYIIMKASASMLYVAAALFLLDSVLAAFELGIGFTSFSALTMICIIYAVAFAFFKRKYGD